jgi:hypothetical protein
MDIFHEFSWTFLSTRIHPSKGILVDKMSTRIHPNTVHENTPKKSSREYTQVKLRDKRILVET